MQPNQALTKIKTVPSSLSEFVRLLQARDPYTEDFSVCCLQKRQEHFSDPLPTPVYNVIRIGMLVAYMIAFMHLQRLG